MELLIIILLVAVAFLGYKYFSLEAKFFSKIDLERNKLELEFKDKAISANQEVRDNLQEWKGQELEGVRQQERVVAIGEAKVQFEQWKVDQDKEIRQDAIQRSQSVIIGKITEHVTPYLPDFNYNPKDARFIGSPIDFVVFDGLDEGEIKEVVFVEVKTGKSSLSPREQKIRDAVKAGKVTWVEIRHPASETRNDKVKEIKT